MTIKIELTHYDLTNDESMMGDHVENLLMNLGFISFDNSTNFLYTTKEKDRILKNLIQRRNKLNREITTLKKASLKA